jgi:hypothetical protein
MLRRVHVDRTTHAAVLHEISLPVTFDVYTFDTYRARDRTFVNGCEDFVACRVTDLARLPDVD